jgi:hypothetical protein
VDNQWIPDLFIGDHYPIYSDCGGNCYAAIITFFTGLHKWVAIMHRDVPRLLVAHSPP